MTLTDQAIQTMLALNLVLKHPPMRADKPTMVNALSMMEQVMFVLTDMEHDLAQRVLDTGAWVQWVKDADLLTPYSYVGSRAARQLRFLAWKPAPVYEPLVVTPRPSNKRAGSVVAFIGKQLCLFDNHEAAPGVNVPVEVMISRVLYGTKLQDPENPDSTRIRDYGRVSSVILRVVDHEKHVRSWTNGFECSGSMCSTTASGRINGLDTRDSVAFHTPGATGVFEADNVNTEYGWPRVPRRPMWIWVDKTDTRKALGLTRFEDGSYASLVRK